MRRLFASIVVAVTALATFSSNAYADEQWCETDPVFIVNNTPIRVTAGLTIDPARLVAVHYDLHVAQGASVNVVATTGARVPETFDVYADQPAGSAIAWLVVSVETSAPSDSVPVTVTTYGPTALRPDVYGGTTNVPLSIAIDLN